MSAPPPSNDTAASTPPQSPQTNSTTAAGTTSTPSLPPPPTATTTPSPASRSNTTTSGLSHRGLSSEALAGLVAGLVIGALIMLVGVGIFVFFYKRNKRKKQSGGPPKSPPPRKDGPSYAPPQYWKQDTPPDFKLNMHSSNPNHSPEILSNPHQPPPYDPNFFQLPSTSDSLGSEKKLHQSPSAGMSLGFSQSTFSYEELATAIDGFSEANLLGQGGFGYVHKGIFPSGRVVAIKQLKVGSGQGEREFQAEVEIISRVHHRHLVSLVGYCKVGTQRMLVYEFVPNNTLEFHLHDKGRFLSWPCRMKIALGSAKGLAYLHEDCHLKIIHRDIKASNILLDYSFEPKVADFGLAKLSLDTETHISTRVMGTFGYLAPEYAASGKLTDKSDVFSFGVVLHELITGRRPVDRTQSYLDDDSIVDWAKPLLRQALEDRNFEPFVDPRLRKDYDPDEMTWIVACAVACVRHSGRRRPRMSQIVRALEGNIDLDELNEGLKPGHSAVYSSGGSADHNSSQYKEDMVKFRKIVMENQEHGSSECSGPTSEYAANPSSSSTEEQERTTPEIEIQIIEKDVKNPDER